MMFARCLLLGLLLAAQDPERAMEAREFKGAGGGRLLYRLYRPEGAAPGNERPLLLFLHGAGERGDDNALQVRKVVKHFFPHQAKYPCFIVAPQCPKDRKWVEVPWNAPRHDMPEKPSDPMGLTMELLDALRKELPLDPKRLYVTGLSMGGYGTWDLLARRPELFAAAVPICGGGDENQAPKIAKIPQWIFHGGKDNVVPTARSRAMVDALRKAGGSPKYTEYPGVGHNSWDRAYTEPDLFPWLFAQKRP